MVVVTMIVMSMCIVALGVTGRRVVAVIARGGVFRLGGALGVLGGGHGGEGHVLGPVF